MQTREHVCTQVASSTFQPEPGYEIETEVHFGAPDKSKTHMALIAELGTKMSTFRPLFDLTVARNVVSRQPDVRLLKNICLQMARRWLFNKLLLQVVRAVAGVPIAIPKSPVWWIKPES